MTTSTITAKARSRTNGVTVASADRANQNGTKRAVFDGMASDERERMLAQHSFRFTHQLGEDPAMNLTEIRKLVEQMLSEGRYDQIFYKTGKSMASGKYSDAGQFRRACKGARKSEHGGCVVTSDAGR